MQWKKIFLENCNNFFGDFRIPIILVQNKIDLIEKLDKVPDFCKENYLNEFYKSNKFSDFYQVSAKSSKNLDSMFEKLAEEIYRENDIIKLLISRNNSISLSTYSIKKNKINNENCCTQ